MIARSRALDVPIYSVSVVSPLDDPASPLVGGEGDRGGSGGHRDPGALRGALGGSAFRVSNPAALRLAADRIAGKLKHQYRLGWDAPSGPSRYRRVEVRSTRKGVTVRTRSGYMPPS